MITAVGLSPANRCDPPGIPYYLPKPLLVVAKNVRHIDESKVGLTAPVPIPGGFDNQAAYADVKANVTVPGHAAAADTGTTTMSNTFTNEAVAPSQSMVAENMTPGGRMEDGIAPDSFFTYQVIFVPDLTQKYGLQISGGAGEFRAAMNMVNGWMYTGMGPFYFKDSSSAQNAMSTGVAAMFAGRGAADVLNEVGELASAVGSIPKGKSDEGGDFGEMQMLASAFDSIARAAASSPKVPREMLNYAEVYIYEPMLGPEGMTDWRLVAEHHFNRHYFDEMDDPAVANAKLQMVEAMVGGLTKAMGGSNLPRPTGAPDSSMDPPAEPSTKSKQEEGGDFDGGVPALNAPVSADDARLNPLGAINSLPGINDLPAVFSTPQRQMISDPAHVEINIGNTATPQSKPGHSVSKRLRDFLHPQSSVKNKKVTQGHVTILPQ